MKKHLNILGLKAKDKLTGLEGVITSVCFDLYGCIQCVITPPIKDSKIEEGGWFDINRVDVGTERIMDVPDYDNVYIGNGEKGAASKSLPN